LNSKTKEELEEFKIRDGIEEILKVRRVLTKRNLMFQLENKFHNMEFNIHKFHKNFNVLNHKGLPGLLGIGDKVISLEYYHHKLYTIAKDK